MHGDPPLAGRVHAHRRAQVRREAARHGGVGEDVLHDQVRPRQERRQLPCDGRCSVSAFLEEKTCEFAWQMQGSLLTEETVAASDAKMAVNSIFMRMWAKRASRLGLGWSRDKFCWTSPSFKSFFF